MLAEEERKSYDLAVQAMKKRCRPIYIEELRDLEFHQKMQGSETIEQVGIALQSVARRAFPKLRGTKEFARLWKDVSFSFLTQMAAVVWSSKARRNILWSVWQSKNARKGRAAVYGLG